MGRDSFTGTFRYLALLAAAVSTLSACGGGGDGTDPTPAATFAFTPAALDPDRDLSERELAAMALHEADLGRMATGLQTGVGWITYAHKVRGLSSEGLINRYGLDYEARRNIGELLDGGSFITQWRDEERAAAVLAELLADRSTDSFSGERCGFTSVPLAEIGDEAGYVTYVDPCEPSAIHWSHGYFRTGRIVGEVFVRGHDIPDAAEYIEGLARTLEGHIERVLAGDLGRPADAPDLAATTIDVVDVGEGSGARFITEQYFSEPGTIAAFERVIAPGPDGPWIIVDGSALRVLLTVARYYASAEDAEDGFEKGLDRFRAFVEASGGSVETNELDLGDQAVMLVGVSSNAEYPAQKDTLIAPMVRVGQTVAYVQVVGCNGVPECGPGISTGDIEGLAEALAARMERVAGP